MATKVTTIPLLHSFSPSAISFSVFTRFYRSKSCKKTIIICSYRPVSVFQEYEKRTVPWLYTFAAFTIFRFVAWVFISIVNDPIFFYNYTMILLWGCFNALNIYGWVLVYSLYLELQDLSKLEDMAHLRVRRVLRVTFVLICTLTILRYISVPASCKEGSRRSI